MRTCLLATAPGLTVALTLALAGPTANPSTTWRATPWRWTSLAARTRPGLSVLRPPIEVIPAALPRAAVYTVTL
eukprot:3052212-Lingulodinium_polyedra.AAC.1